jgi:hypothetical protein
MQVVDNIANDIKRIFGSPKKKEPIQKLEKKPDRYADFYKEKIKELN